MPESSWRESDSYNELESVGSLMADFSDLSDFQEPRNPLYRGLAGRRRKAAFALVVVWSGTIALHYFAWSYLLVAGLTTLMGIHMVRALFARPMPTPEPLTSQNPDELPRVSLMVAAKNEEAVIGRLVKLLCELDYPACCYELWVIDDNSTDRTPVLLEQLAKEYEQLRVFRRLPDAGGGKSGALNQVLPLAQGEIIAVFDADAQVPKDLLRRVLPLFEQERIGAVQVRKAIANALTNFWTRGQMAEMALDAFMQQQRTAISGIGELRGNGQFVRRAALDRCGGWNEETITDDLDLTIRLHLDQWDIAFLNVPAVEEEGVTNAVALWHQRNRWAEGGFQRYLDYWRPIVRNRMGFGKTVDLFVFWMTQYVLPTATVPDFVMAIARNRPLLFSPITALTLTLALIAMFGGLRRTRSTQLLNTENRRSLFKRIDLSLLVSLLQTLRGTLYMFHWVIIIASTTARMSVRPKRLKWVKTVHQGVDEA